LTKGLAKVTAFAALCSAFFSISAEEPAQRVIPPMERSREMATTVIPTSAPVMPLPERPIRTVEPAEAEPAGFSWHGTYTDLPTITAPQDNALVQKYIAQYSSPEGIKWLQVVMRRGEPFLPYIRSAIATRGMPPELAYLPVIESGFLSTAVSKSGAVGLWQFMRNSVGPFGMRINDWTDDRRDFWKATDSALRKLLDNYKYFGGDWPLALASYNAGIGAVGRAAKAAGARDYWLICERKKLKAETIHYVPKFIAIATILSQAGRYGIDIGWPEDPRWTRIPVKRAIDLGLLAEKSSIPVSALQTGNAELRYGVTPPDQGYELKVRADHAAAISATLERKDLQLVKYYFHTVRSGDTLSALSRHYGVSVDLIERSNQNLSARYMKLGSRILVPALKDVGPYKSERAGAVSISFEGQYKVKKGDTLWSIALAHDVDPELLAEANGIELSSTLREGRVLKTPIVKAELL